MIIDFIIASPFAIIIAGIVNVFSQDLSTFIITIVIVFITVINMEAFIVIVIIAVIGKTIIIVANNTIKFTKQ